MLRSVLTWLLLPVGLVLFARGLPGLTESLGHGDLYGWLLGSTLDVQLGLVMLVVFVLLVTRFRGSWPGRRWFSAIPLIRLWRRAHRLGHISAEVRHAGAIWLVEIDTDAATPVRIRLPPSCQNCGAALEIREPNRNPGWSCPACGYFRTSRLSFEMAARHLRERLTWAADLAAWRRRRHCDGDCQRGD